MTSPEQTIYPSLDGNISYIRDKLCHTDDLKVRHLTYRGQSSALVYLESTVDPTLIERNVIRPLRQGGDEDLSQLFLTLRLETEHKLDKGTQSLLSGNCLFFTQNDMKQFYVLTTPAKYERSITEPENEGIIRGAHNGFIEDLTVNLYQIRQQISSTDLKVHYHNIGSTAPRKVAVMYMNNLADPAVVKKVEGRLKGITLDSVISTGFIQEFMEDQPFSIFPQFLNTERPDHTGAYLLDGHVVIMLEGDPTALIVPVSFFCFYQTPDDYSNRWMIASFVRFIRLLSFITAFQLPAFYIAIVAFHSNILPIQLFFTVQGSLTRVPYPPLVEAMLLELIFELLREAGLRLPSRVGQTIGIVGGLVIGDAIVKAGFVSYTMIIVVALTAISSFLIPSNEMSSAIRILRFPLMICASIFGFIGIAFGLTILFIHLCKLESFGKPYLSPLAPLKIKGFKDAFLRFPIWTIRGRHGEKKHN